MDSFNLAYYYDCLEAALHRRGGLPASVAAIVWLFIPFTIQMCFHPADVIRLQHVMSGQAVPVEFTNQMLAAGEVTALIVLVALAGLLQGALVILYRRIQFSVALWPIAGLALGVIGNLLWWAAEAKHGFDFVGMLAGLTPIALTVFAEAGCERLGQDFVFGPGVRPKFQGSPYV